MPLIELKQLEIRTRQRKESSQADIGKKKESILAFGLFHAPGVWFDESRGVYVLSFGEQRTRAIQQIAKEGRTFCFDGQVIQPGFIPVVTVSEALTTAQRFEVELHENTHRTDLDWKDLQRALADLHTMKKSSNPSQTPEQTGEHAKNIGALKPDTGPTYAASLVRQATMVAAHLDDPKIAGARNANEAFQLVIKQQEERVLRELTERRLAVNPEAKKEQEIILGDMFEALPTLPPGQFDLILPDPPYGIDANTGGFRSRTVHHHNYDDTEEYAREVYKLILIEGFRLTKPRANLLMFFDISLFDWLKSTAANMGWVPFPRPMIWGKSDSEGLAPWGSAGPRLTTEFIFFATKGQKGLVASPTDYLRFNRVARDERSFAAEKPIDLLRKLIECSTLPGDYVLDPCCGSGTALLAAKQLRRRALGIEKDETTYNTAISRVYGGDDVDGRTEKPGTTPSNIEDTRTLS